MAMSLVPLIRKHTSHRAEQTVATGLFDWLPYLHSTLLFDFSFFLCLLLLDSLAVQFFFSMCLVFTLIVSGLPYAGGISQGNWEKFRCFFDCYIFLQQARFYFLFFGLHVFLETNLLKSHHGSFHIQINYYSCRITEALKLSSV